ncbi:MAG: flagellar basal body rod protein FlgB [Gammaproteobacteria bacterium]|nr:flagellar basal body rod protein FlgB [Gammaproteobacteria bacterium]
MSGPIDSLFGIHARAMQARAQRGELIANNIANADTPNYKARDVDFESVLRQSSGAAGPGALRTTNVQHLDSSGSSAEDAALARASLKFRTATQPSLDGNTVDMQREQAAFAENNVRYLASLQFLNNRITSVVRVLRGE